MSAETDMREADAAAAEVTAQAVESGAYARFVHAARVLRAAQRALEAASTEYREALEKLSALVAP